MENEREEIPIVYSVDENRTYLKYLVNSISSTKKSTVGRIFILHNGRISNEIMESISRLSYAGNKLKFIDVSLLLNLYRVQDMFDSRTPNLTAMSFARLFIPFIDEFSDYEKVLYIDVDTEITGDIVKFAKSVDMRDFEVAMSYDNFPSTVFGNTQKRLNAEILNGGFSFSYYDATGNNDYCNAGVTLFNLVNIKRHNYRMMLFSMFDMMKRCRFLSKDQDLLNLWFKVKVIDYENGMNVFYHQPISDSSMVKVVHFLMEIGKSELNRRVSSIKI